MRITLILFTISSILLYSCLDEEELPVDALYSEDLIEEFEIFDPCDTITAPNYRVARVANPSTEIERLFHLTTPVNEVLFLGRSLANNADFNKRELFYHGMTVDYNSDAQSIYILSEDNTGVQGFDNVFLLAQEGDYNTNYLLGVSSNQLTAGVNIEGDLFKISLYEIEEVAAKISIVNHMRLEAKSNVNSTIYNYFSSGIPSDDSQEFKEIDNFITLMKSGAYPFDPQEQAKKFDLQLGVNQRDFQFAQGLIEDRDLFGELSATNKEVVKTVARLIKDKIIVALFCLTDEQKWTVSDNIGSNLSSPLD